MDTFPCQYLLQKDLIYTSFTIAVMNPGTIPESLARFLSSRCPYPDRGVTPAVAHSVGTTVEGDKTDLSEMYIIQYNSTR